jgi:hypothetical protein
VKNECQAILEGSAPSKMKEETADSKLRAMDVGALTVLRTFAPTNQKIRMMVVHLDLFAPY